MQFLVRLSTTLPLTMTEPVRRELLAAEGRRGAELVADGVLEAIWRLPGRLANVGIWQCADAAELHDALTSLPLWPYMEVSVEALAAHPLTTTP